MFLALFITGRQLGKSVNDYDFFFKSTNYFSKQAKCCGDENN